MTGVFATAAPVYRAAGWLGTLPLPTGMKWPPPDRMPDGAKHSFTGAAGTDPNDALVAYWAANGQATGNIALRMPIGLIGIDVDAYDGKRGAENMTTLAGQLGPLPCTWRSSARPQPSGILLYRVPDGARFVGELPRHWFGNAPSGVEIIQRHHRYAVVEPSINPETGTPYRWYAPDGSLAGRPPTIAEVPWLPQTWLTRLSAVNGPPRWVPGQPAPTSYWQDVKSVDSAQRQWERLRDRTVGFVRRCEMFGWGGDAHGQLLELTRELAQLAPEHAHRAVGEWWQAAGAGYVDNRVWTMLDTALGKYPADVVEAPAVVTRTAGEAIAGPVAEASIPAHVLAVDARSAGDGSGPTPDTRQLSREVTAPPDRPAEASIPAADQQEHDDGRAGPPRRLPMISDPVWDAYGWTRSIRAQARAADVCPDAVLGAMLASYASRVPPSVRVVTGTKMPLGANLVVSLVGPSGSDKSTAFALAQRMMNAEQGSSVPVIANPGSGEAFAASFTRPDPDWQGPVRQCPKVLKEDPRALFYVGEGALLGSVAGRLGSTWLPHLRALAVDESLSTSNATAEINRQVPAQRYRAAVVVGFQVTTATAVLHDTATGTAQRFLWFTSLSTERHNPAGATEAPYVPMAVPNITRLGQGADDLGDPVHLLTVTRSITERILAEQYRERLTRDITTPDDHDAHRHMLIAKLAALAVLADGRVFIDEADWLWAEALYAASAATRDELLDIAADAQRAEQVEHGRRMATGDRARKSYDGDEVRVAQVILNRVARLNGSATRREIDRAVKSGDRGLIAGALDQLTSSGYLVRNGDGRFHSVQQVG